MAVPEQTPDHAYATLHIDLDALVANWRTIGAAVSPATAGAVVKADAYGLGAVPVTQALADAGCRHFFVAHLGEAEAIREAGILPPDAQLYILNGLMPGGEPACAAIGAVPVLNCLAQIEGWAAFARATGRTWRAALQVDTGMSRLGLSPDEVQTLIAQPQRLEGVEPVLLMSHLACADDPDAPANGSQLAAFERIGALFPGLPRSLDNSGGAMQRRPAHFDIARPGIALYGGAPHEHAVNPMRPVVTLDTRIVQLRTIPPGAGVGYGLSFVADRPTRIATIPVGYADGWPRHLSGKGSAFIAGHRAPIAGRVSMDSITLDVTDVPEEHLYPGAPVELLGPHQGIEDVARDAGTISYEILTRLGHRYARILHAAPQAAQQRRMAGRG
ncbi:alanine racemase [Sphingobium cloacae]|uniref:Alanine racemase n=1 Tax=Sphingobium cloacae TaxID=120107 RepID=A0A1E1F371_9SPHN|nr:alanine racemase [Sphingobium cloacae]BAV64957.1 alanine racemase [Sphingobium cloacae]